MAQDQTIKSVNPQQEWFSRVWNHIKCNVAWYCDTTSLHGFQYVSNKHSSIITRLLFACIICCSVVLCCYLTALQLSEHQHQSILTTVRTTAYPVWKVRFPAVTMCNFNLVYRDNIVNIMNVVKSRGIKENVFMDLVYNLSSLITHDNVGDTNDFQEVFRSLEGSGYTVDRLMSELAHPCDSMVKKCFWQSEEIPCKYVFDSARTSQGYCCSFNYYGTRDTAHKLEDPQSFRYQYAGGAGPTLGLRLMLDIEEEQYISAIRPSAGLHILVQDGADYPDMDLIANTLQTTEELTISVTPRIYIGSDRIKSMDINRRRCLFEDEGDLEWASVYSYTTCITECKAKAILQYCKCVPYNYPLQNHKRFCTLMDTACLENNKYRYSALGVTDAFLTASELQLTRNQTEKVVQCNCYPQCNQRMFDVHTDRAKSSQLARFEYTNISILNVYYSTVGCVKTNRDIYYTWYYVFASIGGIFGFCLGGSLISILECIFFMRKFVPNCRKTELNAVKPKEHGVHVSNFVLPRYRSNFGKKPLLIPKHK